MQHKVGWKPLDVALNCTVQRTSFHAVEHSQIGIQQYLFATDKKDKLGQILWLGNDLSHGLDYSSIDGTFTGKRVSSLRLAGKKPTESGDLS